LLRNRKHTHSGSSLATGSVILFLLIYLFIMIKPVVPYLEYMVRRGYIIENLCINKEEPEKHCNGKCHLEKQVEKEVSGSDKEGVPLPPRNDREEQQEYLLTGLSEYRPPPLRELVETKYYRSYSFQFVPFVFHPPICGINASGTRKFS